MTNWRRIDAVAKLYYIGFKKNMLRSQQKQ